MKLKIKPASLRRVMLGIVSGSSKTVVRMTAAEYLAQLADKAVFP